MTRKVRNAIERLIRQLLGETRAQPSELCAC